MSIFTNFDGAYGGGSYSSMPTDGGGADILQGGSVVGHDGVVPGMHDGHLVTETTNVMGGHDVSVDGKVVHSSHSNAMGGENIYHGSHLAKITVPNALGGVDIYNGDMQIQGSTMPNVFGGEDYLAMHGNFNEVMGAQDPLAHAGEYRMEPFDVTNGMK